MLAIIISALFIALVMVMNGAAGSKYGVPLQGFCGLIMVSVERYSRDY